MVWPHLTILLAYAGQVAMAAFGGPGSGHGQEIVEDYASYKGACPEYQHYAAFPQ